MTWLKRPTIYILSFFFVHLRYSSVLKDRLNDGRSLNSQMILEEGTRRHYQSTTQRFELCNPSKDVGSLFKELSHRQGTNFLPSFDWKPQEKLTVNQSYVKGSRATSLAFGSVAAIFSMLTCYGSQPECCNVCGPVQMHDCLALDSCEKSGPQENTVRIPKY